MAAAQAPSPPAATAPRGRRPRPALRLLLSGLLWSLTLLAQAQDATRVEERTPEQGATPVEERTPEQGTTPVEETLFALELPGKWKAETVDEYTWRYVADGGAEQLTVDARVAAGPIAEEEQRPLVDRLVSARRTAEREAAGQSSLRLGQVNVGRRAHWTVAHYEGETQSGERRFACLVLVSGSSLATFYYEAVGLEESEFLARRKQVFDSISLAEYDYE